MSGRGRLWLLLAAAVGVIVLAAVFAPGERGGDTLDDRVGEIASGLRCPVCQNLSVADSPSRLAGEMRSEIAAQLEAGRTADEIQAFFVERYSEWVLLSPTREGLNLLPWLAPIAGVLIGVALWALVLRRRPPRESGPVSAEERGRIESELASLEEPG